MSSQWNVVACALDNKNNKRRVTGRVYQSAVIGGGGGAAGLCHDVNRYCIYRTSSEDEEVQRVCVCIYISRSKRRKKGDRGWSTAEAKSINNWERKKLLLLLLFPLRRRPLLLLLELRVCVRVSS